MPYIEQSYQDKFSREFQKKILSLVIKDSSFIRCYSSVIKPQYFESFIAIDICRIVLEFYNKYGITPPIESLIQELNNFFEENRKTEPQIEEYTSLLQDIYELQFEDIDYVKDNAVAFAKQQAFKRSIKKTIEDYIPQENYVASYKEISDAMAVGESLEDLGTFITSREALDARLNFYRNYGQFYIPTGYPILDTAINGGMLPGDLIIFMGGTNVGKSMMMVNLGTNILKNTHITNKKIVHITLEGETRVPGLNEVKTMRRYDACITGRNMNEFYKFPGKLQIALERYLGELRNNLVVKYFPNKTVTPLRIKNYLHNLEIRRNFRANIVIIDYADIMSPEERFKEKRHNIASIYEDLMSLAGELQITIITPTQTIRSAWEKEVVNLDDAAEDVEKIRFVPIVFSMCQTRDEFFETPSKFRLILLKNREGAKFKKIEYTVRYETARIIESREIIEEINQMTDKLLIQRR